MRLWTEKNVRDLKVLATAENREVLKRFFKTGKGEYGCGDVFLGLLREVGKRNRARLEEHLKPRYKAMPRTMLRYAIEKFPEPLRKAYLAGEVEQPWVWKSPRRELKKQRRGV